MNAVSWLLAIIAFGGFGWWARGCWDMKRDDQRMSRVLEDRKIYGDVCSRPRVSGQERVDLIPKLRIVEHRGETWVPRERGQ